MVHKRPLSLNPSPSPVYSCMTDAESLREAAATIAKAAEVFGIGADEIVKVTTPKGREIPMRLDELLKRMEAKAKRLEQA